MAQPRAAISAYAPRILTIKVPVGTEILDEDNETLIADLLSVDTDDGVRHLLDAVLAVLDELGVSDGHRRVGHVFRRERHRTRRGNRAALDARDQDAFAVAQLGAGRRGQQILRADRDAKLTEQLGDGACCGRHGSGLAVGNDRV